MQLSSTQKTAVFLGSKLCWSEMELYRINKVRIRFLVGFTIMTSLAELFWTIFMLLYINILNRLLEGIEICSYRKCNWHLEYGTFLQLQESQFSESSGLIQAKQIKITKIHWTVIWGQFIPALTLLNGEHISIFNILNLQLLFNGPVIPGVF